MITRRLVAAWRAGNAALAWPLILVTLALFCALILWLAPAQAHETWWNGHEVDPATKRQCCGDADVKHLQRSEVRVTANGYRLDDTGETVPFARAQPSVDGEFWVFRWGAPVQTQCFFAPVDAS